MSLSSIVRKLAVEALETGAESIASATLTKVGEAIGARIANRINPPKEEKKEDDNE